MMTVGNSLHLFLAWREILFNEAPEGTSWPGMAVEKVM